MLRAIRKNDGEIVEAWSQKESHGPFLCPSCKMEVVLRGGKMRLDHFAHVAERVCLHDLGESENHRRCKAHSSLLGALLVTAFEVAALSRADCPPEEREDFFLYADEFQHCATDSFASILAEARKYRLILTLAHQYLGQVDETIIKAVFGNVGSFISFRVGESDASVLERQFGGGYTRSQFTGLENFELCARLLNREPFFAKALPPLMTSRKRRDIIVRRSREKYSTRRILVEERIERWLKKRH